MTEQEENEIDYGDDEGEGSGFFRWLQAIVVLCAFGGFFGLAWYAYKSGDSTDDKDVELIKVEKTPVKEAPKNPGGMQIPNQDKTVYNLIDNNSKTDKPVAERIMPTPEEPVNPDSGSQTWMSDRVKGGDTNTGNAPVVKEVPEKEQNAAQFNPDKNRETQVAQADAQPTPAPTEAPQLAVKKEPEPAPASTPAPAAPAPKAQDTSAQDQAEEKEEIKTQVKAAAPAPASTGKLPKVRVQLAALGSEEEAEKQWQHIAKKFPGLSGKQHYIVRVTVNGKVFYRLQAAPFDSPKAAESFCANLTGNGQACILAKGK